VKIAIKTALAGAGIAVGASLGLPMAQAFADTGNTGSTAHSGSYGSQAVQREAAKFEPTTKTSGDWGPSQFGSATSARHWEP
jgi:hypothetical protein